MTYLIGINGSSGEGKSHTLRCAAGNFKMAVGTLDPEEQVFYEAHPKLKGRVELFMDEKWRPRFDQYEATGYDLLLRWLDQQHSSDEEVIEAAKTANAHDFIQHLPQGYQTELTEQASNLSQGQRQLISIARAVLHNPRILILDEATSSVDTETEKKIQEALARLVKGRTTFAIAHRLSTLRNADRLTVLEKGKCVEVGTHDELMKKKGVYYKLVELQSEMSRIKAVDG